MDKATRVQLYKLLHRACDSPLHYVPRERLCRRGQPEMLIGKTRNVQQQAQMGAMSAVLSEMVAYADETSLYGDFGSIKFICWALERFVGCQYLDSDIFVHPVD